MPFWWREHSRQPLPAGTTKPERGELRLADLVALPAITLTAPGLLEIDREADPGWHDHVRLDTAHGRLYTMSSMLWSGEIGLAPANLLDHEPVVIDGVRHDGHGRWEVLAHQLTDDRRAWVADAETYLRSGDVAFQAMGLGPQAAARLRDAGWTTWDVACARNAFRLDEDTAGGAAAHPPRWWEARGWWKRAGWTSCAPRPELRPAREAAALAEAGVDGDEECKRRWRELCARQRR